jgi:hypothetical protein
MARGRLVLYAALAIVVALGVGWLWGASGRFSIAEQARDTEQRFDLAVARAKILDARVALFDVNFGDAGRSLEQSKASLERARERFRERGQQDLAAKVDDVLTKVEAARRQAAQLDQSANARAAEAVEILETVISGSLPSPPR